MKSRNRISKRSEASFTEDANKLAAAYTGLTGEPRAELKFINDFNIGTKNIILLLYAYLYVHVSCASITRTSHNRDCFHKARRACTSRNPACHGPALRRGRARSLHSPLPSADVSPARKAPTPRSPLPPAAAGSSRTEGQAVSQHRARVPLFFC